MSESETESESESESIKNLNKTIRNLKITKNQDLDKNKKQKINPFAGGISNKSYIKNSQENILDVANIFKNKKNIQIITDFLNNYKVGFNNPIKGIILRGNIGCGKFTLLKACLKNTNYSDITYDSDYENEDILDNLFITIETKGFFKFIQQKSSNKKAVVIRNIDGSMRQTQKTEFFKFINKSKNTVPVLMTSTDRSVGTEREVPKCILQLDFENPSIAELVKYFSSDKISKSALEKVIEESKFDLRYIDGIINGLKNSKSKININKINNFSKDLELDTFSCIKFCANPNNSWDLKLSYSSLYTNSTLFHNYPNMTKNINICSQIADISCESEELINYAYETQYWETLEESYNILGTIGPFTIMNNVKNNINLNDLSYPSSNLTVYKEDNIDFNLLEKEGITIKIIISKYFNGNKFIGNIDEFHKEIKNIKYPIQAYKLANILTDKKKINSFLREFKKKLPSNNE